MTILALRADARQLPLPDETVDLVVTSPPFLNLRSYTDGGKHYEGQLGTGSRDHFLEELWAVTAECARVLKPAGSMFVELGDSYTDKSLNLTPERYRIGCVDRLGLLVRAEIVWSRPNGLPESVTDRVRRSHSSWVHLTKQPRYFAAVDEIRESYDGKPQRRGGTDHQVGEYVGRNKQTLRKQWDEPMAGTNPLGKLPGSVWEVATEPLKVPDRLAVDHFAAFPTEWPRRLILGWSPSGICTDCGEGRRPVVQKTRTALQGVHNGPPLRTHSTSGGAGDLFSPVPHMTTATITGYACACTPYTDHPGTGETSGDRYGDVVSTGYVGGFEPSAAGGHTSLTNRPKVGPWREYHFDRWTPAPTTPAVCLDPFGGTGTTAHVAAALGRTGISVDLSADYCRLAAALELRHARRRKVLGLDKPPPPIAGPDQGSLFDEESA